MGGFDHGNVVAFCNLVKDYLTLVEFVVIPSLNAKIPSCQVRNETDSNDGIKAS